MRFVPGLVLAYLKRIITDLVSDPGLAMHTMLWLMHGIAYSVESSCCRAIVEQVNDETQEVWLGRHEYRDPFT